jgi:probable rRNA maturation factor
MREIKFFVQNEEKYNDLLRVDGLKKQQRSRWERGIVKLAGNILKEQGIRPGALNIVICDSQYIRDLNRQYRNKDKSTDVLSFFFDDEVILGDIYISVEHILREEQKRNGLYMLEVVYLCVHGVLHLAGFDHGTQAEERIMRRYEKTYYGQIQEERPVKKV